MCSLPSTIAWVLKGAGLLARVLIGEEKGEVLESILNKEFLVNLKDSDRLLSLKFI